MITRKTTIEKADKLDVPLTTTSDESYMDDRQIQHFVSLLEAWKTNLMQEADSALTHLKQEHTHCSDPLDQAVQEEEFRGELMAHDRDLHLIHKIDAALNSIEKGEYGYCEDCGGEIGLRRLEARPTATKCIECKTIEEVREK